MSVFHMVAVFLLSLLRMQTELAAENLALGQQLAVLEHSSKRPKLRKRDRILWVWLSKLWQNWFLEPFAEESGIETPTR